MALKALAAHIIFQTTVHYAGQEVDDASTLFTQLSNAGGKFYPMSDPTIAAGAALCQKMRKRGLNETETDEIMGAFVSAYVASAAAGAVTSVGVTAPITTTGGLTPNIGIVAASDAVPGSMSAADHAKLGGLPADAPSKAYVDGGDAAAVAAAEAYSDGLLAKKGTATLGAGGTVTVATATITAGSKVFVSRNTAAGVPGVPSVPDASLVVGAPGSFDIVSDNAGDTSTVNWLVVG